MDQGSELSIGRLASATGTKVETIRYYERIGLMPAPRRSAGNYRCYQAVHLDRLAFIRRARELGFSTAEVKELLGLAERRDNSCADVDRLVERHIEIIEEKIAALKRLRDELQSTLSACKGGRIAECRVIQALTPRPSRRARRPARALA